MKILVTGGAGYIGSHCVRQLERSGHDPVVLDSLVFGHREAVPDGVPFYDCDLGDGKILGDVIEKEAIEAVIHFAGFAYVGESVNDPMKYYLNNVANTLQLLNAMLDREVGKFVFSSSCTIFGDPLRVPISEDDPKVPVNPYGQTKLDVENALKTLAQAKGLSSASFRYFNASGASDEGAIGEDHDPETHLIPLAIQAVLGSGGELEIYGTDYDTPDGTCLRDYVHVDDLARAHIIALERLERRGTLLHYNLGTGNPYSVREVIESVGRVSGKAVPVRERARRPGDVPVIYADPSRAKDELGWQPRFNNLDSIVETAWRWHQNHPKGYCS